jgi:hypothetical protein
MLNKTNTRAAHLDGILCLGATTPEAVLALEAAFPGCEWFDDADCAPWLKTGIRVPPTSLETVDD